MRTSEDKWLQIRKLIHMKNLSITPLLMETLSNKFSVENSQFKEVQQYRVEFQHISIMNGHS